MKARLLGERPQAHRARSSREDNLTDWAAALTYYSVLSIFPALIALRLGARAGRRLGHPAADRQPRTSSRPGPAQGHRHERRSRTSRRARARPASCSWSAWPGRCGRRRATWPRSCAPPTPSTTSRRAADLEDAAGPRRLTLVAAAARWSLSAIAVVLTGGLAEQAGDLVGLGVDRGHGLGHRQVAGAPAAGDPSCSRCSTGPRRTSSSPASAGSRPAACSPCCCGSSPRPAFALLRRELRLVQQDLRRARRRDRLPGLAVDLEHRGAAGRRVQRRARARARRSRPGSPADQEPFMEPRDTRKMESERS